MTDQNLYFLALNIYQYSFVKTIYRETGGEFIVHKPRALVQLKKNFFRYDSRYPSRDILGLQPKTRYMKYQKYTSLSGILLSTIQFHFSRNRDRLVTINIGHGTGYKPPRDRDKVLFDYYFVDGEMRKRRLLELPSIDINENRMIPVGNLRFDDVVNGRQDREKILDDFGIHDRSRPVILYAPTWKWGAGTLQKFSLDFIREMDKDYNLIIRPHYYDWRRLKPIRSFIRREKFQHVYIAEPWNIRTKDTMENLCISDLLISDNSSIAYQSLIFGIPIVLIDVEEKHLSTRPDQFDLRQIVDHWDGKDSILPLIRDNLKTNKYGNDLKALLNRCFYFNDGKSTERALAFLDNLKQ